VKGPALELELDVHCFRVELARETEAEGVREDREDSDLDRAEEVDGAWETCREMAGEAGAGCIEDGVSSGLLVPLLMGSEK
jgi:hypothetical protein